MFIEILFKIELFKGGVLIYAEHCIYIYTHTQRNRLLHFKKKVTCIIVGVLSLVKYENPGLWGNK